ncbi:MAG: ABC transporter permease, partial [Pseudomonadota bacterium]
MSDATQERAAEASADATGNGNRAASLSLWGDVWRQFVKHRGAMAGALVFIFIILLCFVGPYIHTIDPGRLDPRIGNQGMTWAHPMGTDNLGRDMLAQVMAGGQVSLAVGIAAMLLSLILGAVIGVLSGYFRSLDGALMRLTDLFLALPLLPLLLVIVLLFRDSLRTAFGPEAGI